MPVRVVTDSVSDISPSIAASLGITVVPLNIVIDGVTYRDGVDLTTDEFYRRLEHEAISPTTSTPAPYVFASVFDSLADESEGILVITIGRKLSATADSALKAVELMKKKCQVAVVGSELAMMAEGLLVIAAAKAARTGVTLDELVEMTRWNISRVGIRIAFNTLEYLKRGGRIGKAQAMFGSMLGINPIIGIKDGEVFPFGRERSRARAIDHLCRFVTEYKKIDELAVEDATTPDETGAFLERLCKRFPRDRVYLSKVSPVIGTNVGPRVVGVAVLGDR
jgi:DegV family protein with EDD domain